MAVFVNKRGIVQVGAELNGNATPAQVFNGYTFYSDSEEKQTGTALATATNVTAAKMFAGTTAYNQQGQLITGNPTASTATAADILTGKKAYNNYGQLMTGTLLPSGTHITTTTLTCEIGRSDSIVSQDQSTSVPTNANSVMIEITAEEIAGGSFSSDTVIVAAVMGVHGSKTIWEGGQAIISSYGAGGSAYSTIDSVKVVSNTISFRCSTQTDRYTTVRNTIKLYFYS